MYLLDVNVLIALFWPSHRHHLRARHWFEGRVKQGWATCPFTQTAFVRLLSNPRLTPDAFTPKNAQLLLESNLTRSDHQFWPGQLTVGEALTAVGGELRGHRQITDAYLLGLAIFRKGKLATFDSAIASLLPLAERRSMYIEEVDA